MQPFLAFTLVMLVWTIGEFVSEKTKAMVSMLLIASLIFLIGFTADIFPHDLISDSGLLSLGNAVVGVVIVHLGTTMSLKELRSQWRTFVVGAGTVVLLASVILVLAQLFFDRNIAIAGTAAITGGTLSVLMVQDKVTELMANGTDFGTYSGYIIAVFPLLILNLKNLVGFLVTSNILKSEARRIQKEYRAGNLVYSEQKSGNESGSEPESIVPKAFQTPYGTLFMLGAVVSLSSIISGWTNGHVNTFVIALLLGIFLRHFRILKPSALTSTDSFGLLMISIMVIAFGPLADIVPADLYALITPILFFLLAGLFIIVIVSCVLGRFVGYSTMLSIAVGLTTFFGFPGTMVIPQEAAKSIAQNKKERLVIENNMLPIMVTGGFSTMTITSVIVGGLIVSLMM